MDPDQRRHPVDISKNQSHSLFFALWTEVAHKTVNAKVSPAGGEISLSDPMNLRKLGHWLIIAMIIAMRLR